MTDPDFFFYRALLRYNMSRDESESPFDSAISSTTSFSQPLLPNGSSSDLNDIPGDENTSSPGEYEGAQILDSEDNANLELNSAGKNSQRFALSQDASKVLLLLLMRCRRFAVAIWTGPETEQDPAPKPIKWLIGIEMLPKKLRKVISRPYRVLILSLYMMAWIYIWTRAMIPYFTMPPKVEGVPVISLTCGQVSDFWKGKNAACGMDARFCPTFGQDLDVIFRCPALCDRGLWLYSLRPVGDQILKYRGFYIGGGGVDDDENPDVLSRPYRADSFPCGAAVHAGIVSPFYGGCAKASYLSGPQNSFEPATGRYGVFDSIGFSSFFPKSFIFTKLPEIVGPCKDPRIVVMIFNICMGIPVVFFASGAAFYWIMSVVGYWTISLATDPPVLVDPQDPETLYDLISVSLERFLPTCFVLYVLWVISVKRTFLTEERATTTESHNTTEENLELNQAKDIPECSPVLRLILWYPLFWLGVLNNMTYDRLPIDRLTLHDLQNMPGALLVMYVLGTITLVCIAAQAYYLWLLGRLWRFLKVYAILSGLLIILGSLPGLTLRIHHYIFALLLIPGCSTRGWTAYVFQGLLLGLFLSGVARWGYASIAETDFSLLRGEPIGQILAPLVVENDKGVLYWRRPDNSSYNEALEDVDRYTEVSLLVNDIERFRGLDIGNVNITDIIDKNEHLRKLVSMAMDGRSEDSEDITLFVRLARYSNKQRKYGDYTQTGVLKYPSLDWSPAPPGVT
ncbi:hypothetical protein PUMCH_002070 [Australozyma saopauloensis]|uniref:LCCL domain-containing protein n=1 Tax=Australozyma saopauloensis TaxID=291208 RepID=A0AAX4H8N7_9ASCO|nr:hypothetical protein PUMCH_002070 [[Candida] saopauloensis]